ncbi:hypothetical protein, partial [Ammoniphilus sp. 3BR4]|uniref:hypothetical protein n=1 Tax=Ammoniphilus sp. 3BR4 TaxID=3158265 RepID=UPI003466AAFA
IVITGVLCLLVIPQQDNTVIFLAGQIPKEKDAYSAPLHFAPSYYLTLLLSFFFSLSFSSKQY